MPDLPIVTTSSDWPKHAYPVTVTLTANEWLVLTSAASVVLEHVERQPEGGTDVDEALRTLARYIDNQVVEQGLAHRMKGIHP